MIRPARRPAGTVLALLLASLVLQGCGVLAVRVIPPGPNRFPMGRTLLAPRVVNEADRPIVEEAAESARAALAPLGEIVTVQELVARSSVNGHDAWAVRLVERLARGGWPGPEDARVLVGQLGIHAVVTVDVTAYEQAWAAAGKVTRVRLEARAFDLPSQAELWHLRGAAEVEAARGRAFRHAMEHAAAELAHAVHPQWRFSAKAPWRWHLETP